MLFCLRLTYLSHAGDISVVFRVVINFGGVLFTGAKKNLLCLKYLSAKQIISFNLLTV